ncbi:hypothetical protein ACTAQI_20165 [Pseudarthrobacter sp. alpha12b]
MTTKTTGLARLREPFEPHQINKLPKPYTKDARKGECRECGGYHGLPAMHLDYVGHAALTDRLLEVDPEWSWEPLAISQDGLPKFDNFGGLWIKLRICGVERLGYGDAQGKNGANAVKEAIGDALRNAGMRFGAALDLWHKGDLHDASEEQGKNADRAAATVSDAAVTSLSQYRHEPPKWEELLEKAKNNREMLLDLLAKARGMNADQTVIDNITAAGTALAARTA